MERALYLQLHFVVFDSGGKRGDRLESREGLRPAAPKVE